MDHLKLALYSVLLTVSVFAAGAAAAAEVKDPSFGFRLDIPEGFLELKVGPGEPDTLYKFVDREPTQDDPAYVIQIQRLRGTIDPDSRLKASEIPEIEGMKTTLQEFNWQGYEMDVMRQTFSLPNGLEFVVFGIQYPLSDEAVQVQVGGAIDGEDEIYELFTQVAGSFHNIKPLHTPGTLAIRELSPNERVEKLITSIAVLAATVFVLVLIVRFVSRSLSKKKKSG